MKITMSIEQYKAFKDGTKTELDIKLENLSEKYISEKLKDKKVELITTIVLANIITSRNIVSAADSTIDNAGGRILSLIQSGAYWICLVMCIIEVVSKVTQRDNDGVGKIVLKYLMAFGACHFMPAAFNLIRSLF